MALTREQELQLAVLLREMTFPTKTQELFEAWCWSQITNPVELAVMRNEKAREILLIYREDKFYRGWHMPGSVILPGTNSLLARVNLIEREVRAPISIPRFVGYKEFPRGNGCAENSRGQELSLLFVAHLTGDLPETSAKRFFPLGAIPEGTLGHHIELIKMIREWFDR